MAGSAANLTVLTAACLPEITNGKFGETSFQSVPHPMQLVFPVSQSQGSFIVFAGGRSTCKTEPVPSIPHSSTLDNLEFLGLHPWPTSARECPFRWDLVLASGKHSSPWSLASVRSKRNFLKQQSLVNSPNSLQEKHDNVLFPLRCNYIYLHLLAPERSTSLPHC